MNSMNTAWAWPWWTVMVVINMFNLGVCYSLYRRSLTPNDNHALEYRSRMRVMGVIFALVAAYRAIFVSRYFHQFAWFDTVANSSLLIRTFAIGAELSFAGLIALALLRVNQDIPDSSDKPRGKFLTFMTNESPYILMGSIFLAQFFATSGLIMKSQTLFAIEETLWTIGFLAVLPLAIIQLRRVALVNDEDMLPRLKMLISSTRLIAAWCMIYCSYGLFYHLPLETWPAAIEQLKTGLPQIKTGFEAISQAFLVVHESKEYGDWGIGFLFWHSAYFSICVWIALALMRGPRLMPLDQEPG